MPRNVRLLNVSRLSPACSRLLRDVGRNYLLGLMNAVVDEKWWNCSQVDVQLDFRQAIPGIAKAARIGAKGLINLLSRRSELLVLRLLFRRERRSCETWPAPFLSKRRGRVRPLLRPRLSMPSINSA